MIGLVEGWNLAQGKRFRVELHVDAVNVLLSVDNSNPNRMISAPALIEAIRHLYGECDIKTFLYGPELPVYGIYREFYDEFDKIGAIRVLQKGYTILDSETRKFKKKECDCDGMIIARLSKAACRHEADALVLMSGDGDFLDVLDMIDKPPISVPFEIWSVFESTASILKQRFGEKSDKNPKGKIVYLTGSGDRSQT